jgi:hypothetical protein
MIMNKAFPVIVILFTFILSATSCSKDGGTGGGGTTTVDCNTVTNKAYTTDISPIIQNTCAAAGCHASGSTNGPGQLTNYAEVFSARSAIRSAVSTGRMPQNSTLSTAQKNSIICWVDSGAPAN